MDSSVGPQSTWHLTDQSLSLFDNFGQLDSLDLLSGLEPASGTQQPGFPEHLSNDGGLHASSGNGSAGSGAEYDGLELIPQQAQQARHSAQAKAKELNKAAQKRFREKQKVAHDRTILPDVHNLCSHRLHILPDHKACVCKPSKVVLRCRANGSAYRTSSLPVQPQQTG